MKREYLLIIVAGIMYGTITPGGEILLNDGFSLIDVSFYRAFFISLFIVPVLLIRPGYMFSLEMTPFFAVYGLIGGLLETAMFASLYLDVPVALVVFFLYTQPVWTIIMGRFFLGEKILRKHLLAVGFGIAGIFIMVRSWEIETARSLAGVLIALLAGFLLSLWVIWARKSAIYKNHYITTTFGWSFFASVWLVLLVIISGVFLPQYSKEISISPSLMQTNLTHIVLFALVAGLLPHLLFYKGVEKVSASSSGIILLLEPVSATVIAALIFSDPVGLSFLIGAFFILLSNYFVLSKKVDG